ncbi:transporter substrate-binding domain-containing protein (plasmid) [Sinorhizobium garamanticum]|uniref:Transporter substrate-binding domain-containing protein n=1 Tax=Sinorhizobium garamanticum TaxID=680247 RepID=A0ABY8DN86_9HYPH|nr:transporter substrate-binding domain-containing protein [Sinorhizobium garamanticum]WEX91643.1 transporter substrate-binding domain-containing protein [Sinorhizobium garamanticum]
MKIQKLLILVGMAASLAMATQVASAKDTLKVGMDPLYEPFSFQTPDGKLTGFDYEVSSALCEAIDVTCDIQAIPYDGSIPALQSGKIDVLINTYSMTKERMEKFTMVGPYIRPTFRLIVPANSKIDGSEASLKGKTIGLEKGAAPTIRYANDKFAKFATIQLYDQINEAILELGTGRVDAVFGDENQLFYAYVKKQPGQYKMSGESVRNPDYFGQGQGFILRKGDEKLAERLKTALDTIVKSGKHDQISQKYFGKNILGN